MLLFEGPDRVGKSTAVMAARRVMPGWSYRHHTKPPQGVTPFEYFGWFLADARPTVLIDRLHWSEQAYANAYRQGPELTPHQWRLLELALLALGTTVVALLDDADSILSRYGPAEMHPAEGVGRVVTQFRGLLEDTSQPYTSRLPRVECRLRDLVDEERKPTTAFIQLLDRADKAARWANCQLPPTSGLGYLGSGGFIIVGEAPSDVIYPNDRDPRFPWDKGPAAEWLWQALDLAEAPWWRGYFTNADAFRSASDFKSFYESRRPKSVIALGAEAKALVSCANRISAGFAVKPTYLAHPQYERRFKHSELARYSAELKEAIGDLDG